MGRLVVITGLALLATALWGGAGAAAVADVRASALGAGSASVTWQAAGASRAWVELGRSAPFGVWYPATRQPDGHFTATLTGLAPATTYAFRVRTVGPAGNADALGSVTTAPIPARSAAATEKGRFVIDGQRFFPVMAWWQCPEQFDTLLGLGINVFMGGCKTKYGPDLLPAINGRAYATLPVEDALAGVDGRGLIGWNYHDEPEGYGIPASALPDLPSPSSTGRLRLLTSTYHFYRGAEQLAPGRGHEIYAPYWAKADAIGFDLYPLEKLCSHRLTLRNVYDIQRQLVQENPGKPTYQWLETGPLEGECYWSPFRVTPATLHAEAWLAIAGGAAGIGYFTHTWRGNGTPEPTWSPFDVASDVQAEMVRTNLEIGELAPALTGQDVAVKLAGRSPVVVGARTFNKALYVIAVNPSYDPQTATIRLKGIGSRSFAVFGESRTVQTQRSLLFDQFDPLAVHVYVAAPR
jgi:hypothetical protein